MAHSSRTVNDDHRNATHASTAAVQSGPTARGQSSMVDIGNGFIDGKAEEEEKGEREGDNVLRREQNIH